MAQADFMDESVEVATASVGKTRLVVRCNDDTERMRIEVFSTGHFDSLELSYIEAEHLRVMISDAMG